MKILKTVFILLLVLSCCEAKKKKKPARNCTLILSEETKVKKNKAWKKCDKSNKAIKGCVTAEYEYKTTKVADEYEDLLICTYLASDQYQLDWWETTKTERKTIIKKYKKTKAYKNELDLFIPGAVASVVEGQLEIWLAELEIELSKNYTEMYETAKVRLDTFRNGLSDTVSSYISNLKDAIKVIPHVTEMTPTSNSFHWLTRTEWTPSLSMMPSTPTREPPTPTIPTATYSIFGWSGFPAPQATSPQVADPHTYAFGDGPDDLAEEGVDEGPDDLNILPHPAECQVQFINILTSVGDNLKLGQSKWIGMEGLKELADSDVSGVRLTTRDCITGLLSYKHWTSLAYNETEGAVTLGDEGPTNDTTHEWSSSLTAPLPVLITCEKFGSTHLVEQSVEQPMECTTGFITMDSDLDEPYGVSCRKVWLDDGVREMALEAFTTADECSGPSMAQEETFSKPVMNEEEAEFDLKVVSEPEFSENDVLFTDEDMLEIKVMN